MDHRLLIGKSGAGEPGPLQARVADIDEQNHA